MITSGEILNLTFNITSCSEFCFWTTETCKQNINAHHPDMSKWKKKRKKKLSPSCSFV